MRLSVGHCRIKRYRVMISVRRPDGLGIHVKQGLWVVEDIAHQAKRQVQRKVVRSPILRHHKARLYDEIEIGAAPVGPMRDLIPSRRVGTDGRINHRGRKRQNPKRRQDQRSAEYMRCDQRQPRRDLFSCKRPAPSHRLRPGPDRNREPLRGIHYRHAGLLPQGGTGSNHRARRPTTVPDRAKGLMRSEGECRDAAAHR